MSKPWKQCPSDEHNPTKKKTKSSLSSTILDYYNKYGQNRDLEKYFRFRRQGRSSSDESSSNNNHFQFSSPANYGDAGVSTKSLENLSILRSQLDADKQPSKSRSNESLSAAAAVVVSGGEQPSVKTPTTGRKTQGSIPIESVNDPQENNKSKSNEDIKVNVKNAHKSKRKSWNFNMESNVEIIFPPSIAMQQALPLSQSLPQILPLSQPNYQPIQSQMPKPNSTEYLSFPPRPQETSQTQTDTIEFPKTPIQPIETKVQLTPMPESLQQRPISAASSITSLSNKQRLEWDSLADIGYDKSAELGEKVKKSKSSELTSFEREVLKKFFAQRGLSFDENIVIFGKKQLDGKQTSATSAEEVPDTIKSTAEIPKEKPPKTNRWENAFHKILEEKLEKQHRSEPSLNGKQLWESALKKFRQKYGIRMNNSDLCITHPDIHSTPYSISSSKTTATTSAAVAGISDVGCLTNRSMSMSPSLEIHTKKDETKSTGAIPKITKFMQEKQMIEEQQIKILERLELLEKSCQTSMVVLTSRESQSEVYESRENYNDPKSDNSSSSNDNIENDDFQIEDQIESSKLQKGLESATSFEFLSASAYEKEKKVKKEIVSLENKENISPSSEIIDESKENQTPPEEIKGESENKENIPPPVEIKEENKENIPPLLLEDVNSITETGNQKPATNLNTNADQIVQSILESSTCSRTHLDSLSSKDSFFNDNSNLLLQPDIQKGVELLNTLVETSHMNKATKRKLIKKIVYRLMKIKYQNDKTETTSDIISTKLSSNSSTSSSELVVSRKENITVSGITTLNSTDSSNGPHKTVLNKDKNLKPSPLKQRPVADYSDDTKKDWLQPMTHSELDYEQQKCRELYQKKQKATQKKIDEIEIKQKELQDKLIEKQTKILEAKTSMAAPQPPAPPTPPAQPTPPPQPELTTDKQGESNAPPKTSAGDGVDDEFDEHILRFVSKERNSQLDWIQKEINHLMNLKEFLMGEKKKREMEIMSELINISDNNKKEPNYENIEAENLSKKPPNHLQTKSLSPQEDHEVSPSSLQKQSVEPPPPPSAQPPLESSSSIDRSSSTSEIELQENITPSTTTTTTTNTSNEWNSHKNMKKLARQNRTKLETPNQNDLEMYARAKQQDFIEKYQTMQSKASKLYANNDDECLIYTQPYSSDHYSEPIENQRRKFVCAKSSSAVEPLQRHQYHLHHPHHPHSHFHRQRHQPPLPVMKRHHHHQQQQQQHQQLPQKQTLNDGYTSIVTHSSDRSNDGFVSSNSMSISNGINSNSHSSTTTHQYDNANNNSIGIQTGSSLLKTSPIHLNSASSRHTKLIKKSQQNKEQQTLPQPISYTITFNSGGTQINDVIDQITPKFCSTNVNNDNHREPPPDQQPLVVVKNAKEQFLFRAEERHRCIQELNELRRKRNEQRQRLFLLSTNNNSLRRNMTLLNPPPMEMCRRLFTTKHLKMISREKYQQLPEIKRKDEIERQNRLKRSNRFVMDLFNRNLQRRVLRGNVNLSNSLTVSEF